MEENSVVAIGESSEVSSENGTGSLGGDLAPSVISDCLSEQEEYSSASDSGKGGSDLTPPDSLNATETQVTQWHLCPPYSTYTAYSDSLGKVLPNHAMIYEFEIPQVIVGRLIGRYGTFVNKIKINTGANIIVKRHHVGAGRKICAVEGKNAFSTLTSLHFSWLRLLPCNMGDLHHTVMLVVVVVVI